MRRWVLALVVSGCSSILPKTNPFPEYVISPGVKLAYTFGPRGGWTYGGELSVPIKNGDDLHAVVALGPALNVAWTKRGTWYVRLGLDVVSWFVGLEGGPTWVHDRSGDHFGFGVQAWASGVWVNGAYTYTYVDGETPLHELGVYGKLPICPPCPAGGGGDGSFDFHH